MAPPPLGSGLWPHGGCPLGEDTTGASQVEDGNVSDCTGSALRTVALSPMPVTWPGVQIQPLMEVLVPNTHWDVAARVGGQQPGLSVTVSLDTRAAHPWCEPGQSSFPMVGLPLGTEGTPTTHHRAPWCSGARMA